MTNVVDQNVSRFSGVEFADTYNTSRPTPPSVVLNILSSIAKQDRFKVVLDVGCGTGLSTRIWYDKCDLIIGIEPNDDMRKSAEASAAEEKMESSKIKFLNGHSGQLGMEDESVDLVTVSQALHWMEPVGTFKEVNRVLRKGGVFAAIDCDWPPVINGEAEWLYQEFLARCRRRAKQEGHTEGVVKWEKDEHLQRMKDSKQFTYVREILVHSTEHGTAKRLVDLALSQGPVGTMMRNGITAEQLGVAEFKQAVEKSMGDKTWTWYFCYRIRVGQK
eukprot:TRINITY_DN5894_c0_g1_i1.p1 TRINITY_DN5894_c0_g1~~TRINITY_DN5894_c0_g1_i1.p1  ORF type:complete len:275 (-),score=69.08 TRINITY_DN5894_c0_g1_i1:46-870(-)